MTESPEQAWLDGLAAGRAGASAATNPHSAETELAQDWLDGWHEGRRRWCRKNHA